MEATNGKGSQSLPNKKLSAKGEGKRPRFHSANHSLKKRVSAKIHHRENDIYITNKSDFKAQLKQCNELIASEVGEIFLHCLGNAINRGINLALTLKEKSNDAYVVDANTSTIELIDDFHPLNDNEDFTIQKRLNSCLHIRVYRPSKFVVASTSSACT